MNAFYGDQRVVEFDSVAKKSVYHQESQQDKPIVCMMTISHFDRDDQHFDDFFIYIYLTERGGCAFTAWSHCY
jgi:hypothetical protein